MAIMHCKVRAMENIFQAGVCKIAAEELGKETVSVEEAKATKYRITEEFKKEIGIRISEPEPKKGGNSNTGNVAQRFFEEAEKTSKILKVPVELITSTKYLIDAISSTTSFPDITNFEIKAKQVWKLYYSELGDHRNMSPTFHRLVSHGPVFLRAARRAGVPLGSFSEAAVEHKNSDNKKVRLNFARKMSWEKESTDCMNWLIWSTDPIVNSFL